MNAMNAMKTGKKELFTAIFETIIDLYDAFRAGRLDGEGGAREELARLAAICTEAIDALDREVLK